MSDINDEFAPGAIEVPEAPEPVCSVTFTVSEPVSGNTATVTFTDGTITHEREVNVCLDAEGNYDDAATQARLAEVAWGVENKIAAGLVS